MEAERLKTGEYLGVIKFALTRGSKVKIGKRVDIVFANCRRGGKTDNMANIGCVDIEALPFPRRGFSISWNNLIIQQS